MKKKTMEERLAKKKNLGEVIAALTADSWVPISFVAELQQEPARTLLAHAARDPDFPPLLSLSTFPRARKYVRWGDFLRYREKREALARERREARFARKAEHART